MVDRGFVEHPSFISDVVGGKPIRIAESPGFWGSFRPGPKMLPFKGQLTLGKNYRNKCGNAWNTSSCWRCCSVATVIVSIQIAKPSCVVSSQLVQLITWDHSAEDRGRTLHRIILHDTSPTSR